MMLRKVLVALAAGAALVPASVQAQAYPTRFVTLVVPYAPGGTAEVVARLMAVEMTKTLGQNIVVELKPGAGGNVGSEFVAKAAKPDGYTMLLGAASLATNVSLMKLNFDPRKDLAPVAGIGVVPNLLVVAADSPYRSVSELVAAAKQKAGVLNFGSSGPGTSSHLSGELFKIAAGVDIVHVPYKGSGAVYPDIIGGRITMLFDLAGSAVGFVKGGKTRALATTSSRRSPAMPDVPALAETFPGFEFGSWLGFFVTGGSPKEAIARLEQASLQALKSESVRERLAQIAAEPIPAGTAEFGRYFNDDVEKYARLVREGKLQPIN